MHELSVCQALVEQVAAVAATHGARAVRAVRVRLGPLSGVDAGLLHQAYPLACAGTVAQGSALVLEPTPLRVRCLACDGESEASSGDLSCRRCGDARTRLSSGDEMLLVSVELVFGEVEHV